MALLYVRCTDCLTAVTVDDVAAGVSPVTFVGKGECGACGGKIETLGRVHKADRWVSTTLESPCNAKCTNARGPSCDCSCKCANHGSGVLVEVVREEGKVVVKVPEKAAEKGAEFRAAYAAAASRLTRRFGSVVSRKERGEYLGTAEFMVYLDARHAYSVLAKCRALRTHKGRLKALESIEPEAVAA